MPEYYLVPKRAARRWPVLGRVAKTLEAGAFRSIFWLIGRLSPERASAWAGATFGFAGRHSAKAKKAEINLQIAFPDKSPAWRQQTINGIFRSLGKSAAELIKLDEIWQQRDTRLQFEVDSAARAALESGQAAVFVTAHTGPWQIVNLIALHMNLRISTIYAPESNAALRDKMLALRKSFGVNLIPSDAGARPLLRELNAGHCIGMAMDTRLDTGQLIPFFGREALTNITAARLALRTGALLLPIRAQRLGKARYKVSVYAPIEPDAKLESTDEQAVAMSAAIHGYFETWIREQPDQWICLKRRWPKAHRL